MWIIQLPKIGELRHALATDGFEPVDSEVADELALELRYLLNKSDANNSTKYQALALVLGARVCQVGKPMPPGKATKRIGLVRSMMVCSVLVKYLSKIKLLTYRDTVWHPEVAR